MITSEQIAELIKQGLPGAEVMVQGDDGRHFSAVIVYADFKGKTVLAQHRMVYAALGDKMREQIHALSLQTKLPSA